MGEFPLVIFTVLSQLAAGALITTWLLDSYFHKMDDKTGKFITVAIIGATGLSMVASLFHLGNPLSAYRALTHLTTSWLSREVLLFSLFLLLLVIYYLNWQENKYNTRKTIGAITSAIAILAVISSGMVYVLPARPAWNNFSPVIFFLLTAGLLGPLFVGTLLTIKSKDKFSSLLKLTGTMLTISLISFIVYISLLLSSQDTALLTGLNMVQSSTLWLRIIIGWIVPFAILIPALLKKNILKNSLVTYLFLLILVGEFLGRELFYSSIAALQVAGF